MCAAVSGGWLTATLALVLAAAIPEAGAQGTAPLRKTDLVRLLGGRTLSSLEIARLVRRNCVSFTPSDRDRRDLVALGADAALLASLDACSRRRSQRAAALPDTATRAGPDTGRAAPAAVVVAPAATAPASPRVSDMPPPTPPTTVVEPVPPNRPEPPARLVALEGAGQRGVAGSRGRPLSVRVTSLSGAPASAVWVRFTSSGAAALAESVLTDSAGVASTQVVLGAVAGPASVTARSGPFEVVMPLTVLPGPPVELVLEVGGNRVRGITQTGKGVARVVITARDAHGNRTPLGIVRFSSSSERVARIGSVEIGPDSAVASVEFRNGGATEVRFASDQLSQALPVRVNLASGSRSAGLRVSYTTFDYHWALRPNLRSHPGQILEAFAMQTAFGGLSLGFGGAFGALEADTASGPAVTTVLVEALLRADYSLLPRSRFSPVVSLLGGGYRMKSDAEGALVFHTYLFWGAGVGVDVALGTSFTGELRVARQSMLDYVGEVAVLVPVGAGVRFRF